MCASVLGSLGHSVIEWPGGVTVYKPEKCASGYTIFSPFFSPLVYLIDMAGRVVHTWEVGSGKGQSGNTGKTYHAKYVGEGRVLISVSDRAVAPPDYGLREVDWEGNITWEYPLQYNHHDFQRLPNGNTLMLYSRFAVFPDFSDIEIRDDLMVEVTPDKEIVWEWDTLEHVDEFGFSGQTLELMKRAPDPWHNNTVEILPPNPLEEKDPRFRAGNILVSHRSASTIAIIDKAARKVSWHWGPGVILGQHHPQMLPDGNIIIYDNGGRANYPAEHRFWTRLVEMSPRTEELSWEYRFPPGKRQVTDPDDPGAQGAGGGVRFLSNSWGSIQRLSNGNTLSLDANCGRLFEVTPGGEIVWEFVNPHIGGFGSDLGGTGVYRCYRVPYDAVPMAPAFYRDTDGHGGGPVFSVVTANWLDSGRAIGMVPDTPHPDPLPQGARE